MQSKKTGPDEKAANLNTVSSPPKDNVDITEKEALTDSEAGSLKTIERKKLSWQQAAALLFGEYVVIAILSFASSYSVLGWAGGFLATIFIGIATLWTSHILWRYCMQHPDLVDICTLGYELFGRRRIAYELTMLGFVLNNLFIMALHVLSGSIAINTLSDHATCTIVWTVIFVVVMFAMSLSRELKRVAIYSVFAAATMLIALILCLTFAGAEDEPAGFVTGQPPTIRAWAASGTTFVAGLNAVLNITYTYVGQVLVPTYVQDMAHPEDFPKALYACTLSEIVLFTIGGAVIYNYVGDQYVTSPAYGALQRKYAKIVAGFTIPTILVVGVLYATITSRTIYYRIFGAESIHVQRVTKRGTVVWIAIVATVWTVAFIIGEAIPFFNDLLALMSSLFDSWFGFIFWGVAYFRLYPHDTFRGTWRITEAIFSVIMIAVGLFLLGAGTYSSVEAIRQSYADGTVPGAFSCSNNGF